MELYTSYFTGIKAVIFDFDNTVYDFKHLTFRIIAHSLRDILLVKSERSTRRELKGKEFDTEEHFHEVFFQGIAQKTGKTTEHIREWYFSVYLPRLVRVLKKNYSARPGCALLFENLKKSAIRCAVYSDYAAVSHRLEAIGLNPEQCGLLYCSEKLGSLKPSSSASKTICEDLHLQPSQILMIGDREDTDIAFAKNSGMHYIQIKTHKTKKTTDPAENNLMEWDAFVELFMQFIKANPQEIISA
ncbi:MAG TPA: HAD family hydrolase [Treponemataceae bacterium]|nr:HAD family hydrolase [Treponemataceae bacterium]